MSIEGVEHFENDFLPSFSSLSDPFYILKGGNTFRDWIICIPIPFLLHGPPSTISPTVPYCLGMVFFNPFLSSLKNPWGIGFLKKEML